MDTQIEQLERLAALHRAGSLTDAEYEAQKARVLAGPTSIWTPRVQSEPVNEADLSMAWQRRFAFFRAHGSPLMPPGAAALQKLPFGTAASIRFNIWGFLLGPIYFFVLGLWRRGAALLGINIIGAVVLDRLFGDGILTPLGFGWAAVYAMSVNYYRYIKLTQGRDEWNPIKDLLHRRAAHGVVARLPLTATSEHGRFHRPRRGRFCGQVLLHTASASILAPGSDPMPKSCDGGARRGCPAGQRAAD